MRAYNLAANVYSEMNSVGTELNGLCIVTIKKICACKPIVIAFIKRNAHFERLARKNSYSNIFLVTQNSSASRSIGHHQLS